LQSVSPLHLALGSRSTSVGLMSRGATRRKLTVFPVVGPHIMMPATPPMLNHGQGIILVLVISGKMPWDVGVVGFINEL